MSRTLEKRVPLTKPWYAQAYAGATGAQPTYDARTAVLERHRSCLPSQASTNDEDSSTYTIVIRQNLDNDHVCRGLLYPTGGERGLSYDALLNLVLAYNYDRSTQSNDNKTLMMIDADCIRSGNNNPFTHLYEQSEPRSYELRRRESSRSAEQTVQRPNSQHRAQRIDALAGIQSALALPIRTLAAVLSISPPQMYRWLDAESEVKLSNKSTARLRQIENLAMHWAELCTTPLSTIVKAYDTFAPNLLKHMSADALDSDLIKQEMSALGQRAKLRPMTLSERMSARGVRSRSRTSFRDDE